MTIYVSSGEATESVLKSILERLTDADLDEVEIKREFSRAEGFASEPVTISVVIVASAKAIAALASAITAYLTYRAQKLKADQSGVQPRERSLLIEATAAPSAATQQWMAIAVADSSLAVVAKT